MSLSFSSPLNPYEEAKLYTTNTERERWENNATLFSLIVSLEYLERAYVREGVSEQEYTPACTRLLSQYKTIIKLVTEPGSNHDAPNSPPPISDVEHFMRLYEMDHPAAAHRLRIGVPATVEHSSVSSSASTSAERAKLVAETTQAFITFMDALKLSFRAKDQLHPMLGELMSCIARVEGQAGLGGVGNAESLEELKKGRAKLLGWLISLNSMKASDELDEEQARQMLFDTDGAYSAWFKSLAS